MTSSAGRWFSYMFWGWGNEDDDFLSRSVVLLHVLGLGSEDDDFLSRSVVLLHVLGLRR